MPDVAFLNRRFIPLSRAKVSVEDRGFQFGDGIYELIRSYGGRLFHVEDHIRRLLQSLHAIHLPPIYDMEKWREISEKALKKSGYPKAKIYVQVTRGRAPRDHCFPDHIDPTVVITVREMEKLPKSYQRDGVSVITAPDIRWSRCDIKSINLLPNILAKQKAKEEGVLEVLFLRDGWVLEGAGSNVFSLRGDKLVTPPKGIKVLSGVTREAVIQLGKGLGLTVSEEPLSMEFLLASDEVLLTATTLEVLPVVAVDGKTIGSGKPGPMQKQLYEGFLNLVRLS